jgi:DNA-binding response OmpR family regulator
MSVRKIDICTSAEESTMERTARMSGPLLRGAPDIEILVITNHADQDWALGSGHRVTVVSPETIHGVSIPDVYFVDVVAGGQLPLVQQLARGGSQAVVVFGPAGHPDAMRYLDAGAADYISPRTSGEERRARVRAAARRNSAHRTDPHDALTIGSLSISLSRHEIRKDGELVPLTPHEFELLAALLQTPNELVPHHKLMVRVWGVENSSSRHYLRIYIRQLRKKLEADPEAPTVIVTERGRGYAIRTTEEADSGSISA